MEEFIAGVDEVGRGSLVGPVVAAAVILGRVRISELKDSKKLSESKRSEIAQEIKTKAQLRQEELARETGRIRNQRGDPWPEEQL